MRFNRARGWCLGIVGVVAAGYVGLRGYLFVGQRHAIYFPSANRLEGPPPGSGYQSLDVIVPRLGTLKDWWVPPASVQEPTIVFFHGNASNRSDFMKQGMLFHQRGWGVVLASYRGYSGNPGEPTESGLIEDARRRYQPHRHAPDRSSSPIWRSGRPRPMCRFGCCCWIVSTHNPC